MMVLSSSAAKTYVNVIAVKEGNENSDKIKALVDVLKSDEIKDFINEKYDGAVIPFEDSKDTEAADDAQAEDSAETEDSAEAEDAADTAISPLVLFHLASPRYLKKFVSIIADSIRFFNKFFQQQSAQEKTD